MAAAGRESTRADARGAHAHANPPLSAEDVPARFSGAKADIVRRHLDILLVMGEIQENPDGRYQGTA